jgi:hypothetical protein
MMRVRRRLERQYRTFRLTAVCVFAALCAPALVAAQAPCADKNCPTSNDLESARGLAMGTGTRASSISTSAIAYNPAGVALGKLYHIEGQVDYQAEINTVGLGAAVVDSSTTIVGAGMAFRGFLTGKDGSEGLDGKLVLALPIGERFAVGLAGRYVQLTRDTEITRIEPDGSRRQEEFEQELLNGFTMDGSILVQPLDGLMLEALAQNFIDMDSPYAPVLIGGGVSFGMKDVFVVGGDLLADLSTFESATIVTGFGAEVIALGVMPLRLGYEYDTGRLQHHLTAGVGYSDEELGLDLSLDQGVNGPYATRIMFSMSYKVH